MLNLEFKIKPSWQYLFLLAFVFLATAAVIFSLQILWIWKGILFLTTAIYCWQITFRYALLKAEQSIISIKYEGNKTWTVQMKSGQYRGELCGDSLVTTFVCVMRFRIPGKFWPRSCVIFQDALDDNQHRHLLTLLKFI